MTDDLQIPWVDTSKWATTFQMKNQMRDEQKTMFHEYTGYLKGLTDYIDEPVPQKVKLLIDAMYEMAMCPLFDMSPEEFRAKYSHKSVLDRNS